MSETDWADVRLSSQGAGRTREERRHWWLCSALKRRNGGFAKEDFGREFKMKGSLYRIEGWVEKNTKYKLLVLRIRDETALTLDPWTVAEILEQDSN